MELRHKPWAIMFCNEMLVALVAPDLLNVWKPWPIVKFIYLFGVLRRFQHCTGHIMTGSWKGRGNQYIQFVRVLYCKLPTNGKQLPAFPHEAMPGTEPRPPLCHHDPWPTVEMFKMYNTDLRASLM